MPNYLNNLQVVDQPKTVLSLKEKSLIKIEKAIQNPSELKLYRQGDMLLKSANLEELHRIHFMLEFLDEVFFEKDGILLDGVHPHRLKGGIIIDQCDNDISNAATKVVFVESEGKLIHEEHDHLDLMAGWYLLLTQREMANLLTNKDKMRRRGQMQIWD